MHIDPRACTVWPDVLRSKAMRQTFRWTALAGLVLFVMAIGLQSVLPLAMGPLPEGMWSPIVAFELARSPAEIEAMFGAAGSAERDAWVAAMDLGNQLDFVFLLAYGAVLLLFSRALRERGLPRAPSIGERIVLVALVADAFENVQLLTITENLGGEYRAALGQLMLYTWMKWIAIALVMATWIPELARAGRMGRVVAGLAGLTAITTIVAAFVRGVAAEAMALGVVLTLGGVITFAFVHARRDSSG